MVQRLTYALRVRLLPRGDIEIPGAPAEILAAVGAPPLVASAPDDITLVAVASEIDATIQAASPVAASPTDAILQGEVSEVDATLTPPSLIAAAPDDATIGADASEIDATIQAPVLAASAPDDALIETVASQIDATIEAPNFNVASSGGAVCLSGGAHLELLGGPTRSNVNFVVHGWVKFDEIISTPAVFSKWNFPQAFEWVLFLNSSIGQLEANLNDSGSFMQLQNTTTIVAGKWYFFAIQREAMAGRLWVGDVDNAPTAGPDTILTGTTGSSFAPYLAGAQQFNNVKQNFLAGSLDKLAVWKSQPTWTIADLWAANSFADISSDVDALGGWWDLDDSDPIDNSPDQWLDAHKGNFHFTSVPLGGPQSCPGVPSIEAPIEALLAATPSQVDATVIAPSLTAASATEDFIGADASQIDATIDAPGLFSTTPSDVTIGADASQIDATVQAPALAAIGPDDIVLGAFASQIDATITAPGLLAMAPLPVTIKALTSQIDATIVAPGLSAAAPQDALITADASQIDATIVAPQLVAAGAVDDLIGADASQVDATIVAPALQAAAPDDVTIGADPSQIDATIVASPLEAAAPDDVTITAIPSEIDATVNPFIQIATAKQAICFSGEGSSYAFRNINTKAGISGFEQGVAQGHIHFWARNINLPNSPNAGWVFSASRGTVGASGPRLQMGFTGNGIDNSIRLFFESDNGTTTVTAESVDIPEVTAEWTSFLLGFDPARVAEDNGGWIGYVNGQEVAIQFTGGQQENGRWFQQSQPTAGELFNLLTMAVSFDGGAAADRLGICIDELVLRPTIPTQQLADYYFRDPGRGPLITEMFFTPGINDFAWRFTNDGPAELGDEFWGDDTTAGRDTSDYFDLFGEQPLTSGIRGLGNPEAPPDVP